MSIENEEVSETALDDAPEYLNMSDEDMMNMTPPEPTQAVEAPASVSAAEVPGTAGGATEESDTPEVTTDEPIPEAEDTPEQVAKDVQRIGAAGLPIKEMAKQCSDLGAFGVEMQVGNKEGSHRWIVKPIASVKG